MPARIIPVSGPGSEGHERTAGEEGRTFEATSRAGQDRLWTEILDSFERKTTDTGGADPSPSGKDVSVDGAAPRKDAE